MVYLAFDMDGTIGEFTILKQLLCIFNQPAYFIMEPEKTQLPDEQIKHMLSSAYTNFVNRIIAEETGPTPLGVFRPGVFKLFQEIHKLRISGMVKGVIIYSNNRTESLVEFIKDVLNTVVGAPVIDTVFFRFSKQRTDTNRAMANPEKTWAEIKQLLLSIGAPEELKPNDVLFFDDIIHADLKEKLGINYIHVEKYVHNPPMVELLKVYRAAVIEDTEKTYASLILPFLTYIKSCGTNPSTLPESFNSYLTSILEYKPKYGYKPKGTGSVPANNTRSTPYMLQTIRSSIFKKKKIKTNGGKLYQSKRSSTRRRTKNNN